MFLHKRLGFVHGFVAYDNDDKGGGGDDRVPRERLNDEIEKKKAAEKERDDLKAKLAEAERKDMAEVDRLKAELEEANTRLAAETERANDAETAKTTLERETWIRAAASRPETKFHDPADAIFRLRDVEIKTEAAAQKAVTDLAESADHLVAPKDGNDNAATRLEQVLSGGKPVKKDGDGAGDDDKSVISPEKFDELSQDELVQLQESDPALYERSIAAAAASE